MARDLKGGGIKHLLLAHCEKAIALLIVGAAIYVGWMSMSFEQMDKEQSELVSLVSSTDTIYDEMTWDKVELEDKLLAHPVASPQFIGHPLFAESLVTTGVGPSRPVMPPIVDRTDPPILTASDLEVSAVTGIFAFVDDKVREQRELERIRQEQEKAREQAKARENREAGIARETNVREQDREERDDQGRAIRRVSGRVRQVGAPTQGDERQEQLSAVCVVGKAPLLEQFRKFEAAFKDANGYDERRDLPQYMGAYVERAEVRGDDTELQWKPVKFGDKQGGFDIATHDKMVADWVATPETPDTSVDSRYIDQVLTMQLAPLVKQDWGMETIHSEAPTEAESAAEEAAKEALEEDDEEGEEDPGLFAGERRTGGARSGASSRSRRRFGGGGFGGFEGGFDGGYEGGFPEGGFDGGGFEGGGYGSSSRSRMSSRSRSRSRTVEIDPDVPFVMIRFWDFDVEPGRQYRYRVKLVLSDPNADEMVRPYLSPEVAQRLDKNKRIMPLTSEWSDPSPVVSVPLAGDALVATVKPRGKQAYSEGEAELLVQSYSLDGGRAIKAGIRDKFRRGDVLNLVEDSEFLAPDGRTIVEADSFAFTTGLTVADFRGGDELPSREKSPGRVLLMDATGKLFVRSELDDAKALGIYEETFAESDETSGGFRGGYEGGGFDGGFEGGFEEAF